MFRKYSLLVCLLPLLTVASVPAQAQTTMDAVVFIQNVTDLFSHIRTQMKQIESGLNIEQMANNLGAGDALKSMSSKFLKKPAEGVQGKTVPYLPTQISGSPEDAEASATWLRTGLNAGNGTTPEEVKTEQDNQKDFLFVAMAQGYGKALALRVDLDKDFAELASLQEDAKNSESDVQLLQLINDITVKKVKQETMAQVVTSTKDQVAAQSRLAADLSKERKY